MPDDCWYDNVGPLLQALYDLDIDPVDWAYDHSLEVFWGGDPTLLTQSFFPEKRWLPSQPITDIHFACGYLQATSNLTGRTWARQIDDYLRGK